MKKNEAYNITIYCGLKERNSGKVFDIDVARKICQKYVDEIGWCISLTKTEYIYSNGSEPGIIVGIIQYPRFPLNILHIRRRSLELSKLLLDGLKQYNVSIVYPDKTIMIEKGG